MSLDIKAAGDWVAVSHDQQTDATTAQTIDKAFYVDEASTINIAEVREHNQEEKTGHVEPTDIDVRDRSAEGTITVPKARPDSLAWAFAFGFDNHPTASAAGGGYLHTSKLSAYPEQPPYFTLAHRMGGSGTNAGSASFYRHIGLGINTLTLNAAKEEFMSLALGLLGTGEYTDGVVTHTFTGESFASDPVLDYGAASLPDPHGGDANAATNITVYVDVADNGTFEEETSVTAVDTTADTITIDADGQTQAITGSHDVRISYQADNTEAGYTWMDDTAASAPPTEFQLKAANIQIILGADMDDTPAKTGGQVAGCEIEQFTYELNWNGNPGKCWRTSATESNTAQSVDWGDPLQTITVNRRVRDYLFKQHFDANTAFGVYLDAIGPEYEAGQDFEFRLWIPRCKFLEKPLQVSDGKWIEAGNIIALKDATNDYATAIAQTRNEQQYYLDDV